MDRTRFIRGGQLAVVAAIVVTWANSSLQAANIIWTTTDFNVGNLDLSGNVIQAINFSASPQTVTIGGNMVTFASSSTIGNGGFANGPNENAAGVPTYTNVVGNAPLGAVLASHSWTSPAGAIQPVTLSGLFSGQMYEIQAFMSDTRATIGDQTLGYGDNGAIDTALVTRNSGTIAIGAFTADGPTQTFLVGGGTGDAALSGYVLKSFSVGNVAATLNRATGNLSISNTTSAPLDMLGYTVSSPAGALNQASWTTIANNYDKPSAPTPGNGSIDNNDAWTILSNPASHADLSEAELVGGNGGAIGVGQTLNLGNVWIKNPTEDLAVRVLRTDGTIFPVSLSYTGNGGAPFASGDLNFNGALDPADWTVYISNALTSLAGLSQAERYQRGDFNNDGINNLNDMDLFIEAYEAANGAGAFAAMVAGVPEPGAGALLLVGCAALAFRRVASRVSPKAAAVALALMSCVIARPSMAQLTYNPVPTSGHDQDIIFEAGLADGAIGANGELGSRQFFEEGVFADGLPRTLPTFTSPTSGNMINFAFEPFEENNILKFTNTTMGIKTLTLDAPSAYSNLAIVHSGGSMSTATEYAALGFTINYQGGATQTGVINSPDWGAVAVLPPGTDRIFTADRTTANATTAPIASDNNTTANRWAIYVSEITVTNPGVNIVSVDFGPVGPTTLQVGPAGETPTPAPLNSGDDVVIFGLAGPGVPPPAVTLQVNTTSGLMEFTNPTEVALEIKGYEITSAAGSLNFAGWNSFSDQNLNPVDGDDAGTIAGDSAGETWDEGAGSSDFGLLEGFLLGSSAIAPSGSLSIGAAFDAAMNVQDLSVRVRKSDGALTTLAVEYVTGGGPDANFNNDAVVDAADLNIWKSNFGSTAATDATGDADGDGDADGNDFLLWQRQLGAATPAAAAGAAVPEPAGLMLLMAACVALVVSGERRRRPVLAPVRAWRGAALMAAAAFLTVASTASAAVTIDRDYRFGDDVDEHGAENIAVGSGPGNVSPGATLDSQGPSGAFNDLLAFGETKYVDVGPTGLNRPGAAPDSLGIQFDGNGDHLRGLRLGYPSTSPASTGNTIVIPPNTTPTPGPLNYTGLSDRGFQLWVRPDSGVTTLQEIVADTNQHGLRINAAGNWVMRYNGTDVASSVAATPNAWTHAMVVRPYGAAVPNGGSVLYINGVAVAARPGNYTFTDQFALVVGSDTGDGTADPVGSTNYFKGVLDDLTMFVSGVTADAASINRGTFNLRTDNALVASALAGVAVGDLNRDNAVNSGDASVFVSNWLSEKRVNNVRAGDLTTVDKGDLNFDGITDLADAFILHAALVAATGAGLDFSLLGVPEPSTLGLAASALIASAARRRRRQ